MYFGRRYATRGHERRVKRIKPTEKTFELLRWTWEEDTGHGAYFDANKLGLLRLTYLENSGGHGAALGEAVALFYWPQLIVCKIHSRLLESFFLREFV